MAGAAHGDGHVVLCLKGVLDALFDVIHDLKSTQNETCKEATLWSLANVTVKYCLQYFCAWRVEVDNQSGFIYPAGNVYPSKKQSCVGIFFQVLFG